MAEVLRKQRKSNFSQEEVDTIIRAVSENYHTLYGEFSKKAVNKSARHRAWLEVTNEVNLVSNERRTLQEVKNKWKKCQHLYRSDDCFNDYSSLNDDVIDVSNVWEPLTEIEDEDSMPLEQRLRAPSSQTVLSEPTEPVLQSQPLSPTKLKVTRQAKPSQPSSRPVTSSSPVEEVCLKWNSHHSNMQNTFPNLLLREQYVDATLVAEGQTLKCHRVILSSCSPYFEEVLASISPYQHPVLFMKDVPFWILKCLCDFMYAGEVHILQIKLEELLAVAESLQIKGLAGQKEATCQEVKLELPKLIKEEVIKEDAKKKEDIKRKDEKEVKKKDEKEIKRKEDKEMKRRDDKEVKKKEEKELKKKDDKEIKNLELRQPKRKDEKEIKKREEIKDRRKIQSGLPLEMPVLKNVKSVKMPLQHTDMPILKCTKSARSSVTSRRIEKKAVEKEKILEKPSCSIEKGCNNDFLEPLLDLLEPVYEEVANDSTPTEPVIPKLPKNINIRRNLQKKLKKRKISDDREESPPPVLTRKGTRSRPNRKIPKYFHPSDDQSTIVREPHTDQADPLMHLQCIKSEPIYDADDSIEIEDNLVGFSESSISVEEQLIGSYEQSSFTSYARRSTRRSQKDLQPIIMDVQSIANNKETLNIINVADLRDPKLSDPLEDPLTLSQTNSGIVEVMDNTLGFRISQVVTEREDSHSSEACADMGFQITNVVSEQETSKKSEEMDEDEEEEDTTFIETDQSTSLENNVLSIENDNCDPCTSQNPELMGTNEDVKPILNTISFLAGTTLHSNNIIDNSQPPDKEKYFTDYELNSSHDLEPKTTIDIDSEPMDTSFEEHSDTGLNELPVSCCNTDEDKKEGSSSEINHNLESEHMNINPDGEVVSTIDIFEENRTELLTCSENFETNNPDNESLGNDLNSDNQVQNEVHDLNIEENADIEMLEDEIINKNNISSNTDHKTFDENTPDENLDMAVENVSNEPQKDSEVDNSLNVSKEDVIVNEDYNDENGKEDNSTIPEHDAVDPNSSNVLTTDQKTIEQSELNVLETFDSSHVINQNLVSEGDTILTEDYLKSEATFDSGNDLKSESSTQVRNEAYFPIKNSLKISGNEELLITDDLPEQNTIHQNNDAEGSSSGEQVENEPRKENDPVLQSTICNDDYVPEASSSNITIEDNAPEENSSDIMNEDFIAPMTSPSLYQNHDELNPIYLENTVEPHPNCILKESNSQSDEYNRSSEPGFHIAQVISEQIAEIEGSRHSDSYMNDSKVLKEPCEKNYNELESIVNDLSKIVGDTCEESSLGSGGVDDTNSIAESLENLLQK